LGGRKSQEEPFLIGRRWGIDPLVYRRSEPAGELDIACSEIEAKRCRHFSREQAENHASLVGCPCRAVGPLARRPRTFLTAKPEPQIPSASPDVRPLS
jgi:hypothetical protein